MFPLMLVGSVMCNIKRDFWPCTALGGVLMFVGFVMLFAGAFLLPRLANWLPISGRVYEKETGI